MPTHRLTRGCFALALALGLTGAAIHAQTPIPAEPVTGSVAITAGRSTVLTTPFDITRVAVTNPAIADATVVRPREILIDGKGPGTVSLIVWGGDLRNNYDIVVEPTVLTIEQRLRALFPGEDISVSQNDEALIMSGQVSSNQVSLRAAEVAQATTTKLKLVNLLKYPGGDDSQQVLLQVRVAEVSRTALAEMGVSFFTSPQGIENNVGRVTTQRFAAPTYNNDQLTFSDFLNLFLFNTRYDIGAVVRALRSRGLIQSLAEPNLIAYNNQDAGFLAGGEIPIPVVQGGGINAVTIQWREYGVRLNFRPTIAGDTIRLKVRPEVSTLDFANGISFGGFRIPALSVRRAETDVELKDGQSFAIAGLLNNLSQDVIDEVPGLARLPIIGPLFRSKASNATRNELMVLVTPRLVRPLNPDEVPSLPTQEDRFLPSLGGVSEQIQGGAGAVDAPQLTDSPDR